MDKILRNIAYLFEIDSDEFVNEGAYYCATLVKPYFLVYNYISNYIHLISRAEPLGDGIKITLDDYLDNKNPIKVYVIVLPDPNCRELTLIRVVYEEV